MKGKSIYYPTTNPHSHITLLFSEKQKVSIKPNKYLKVSFMFVKTILTRSLYELKRMYLLLLYQATIQK